MKRLAMFAVLTCVIPTIADEPRRDRFGDPLPAGAVARLGSAQAHPFATTVAFADGKTVVTTSAAMVRYWDAEAGRVLRSKTHQIDVEESRQVISADGRYAATVFEDRLEVFDLEQNKRLHRIVIPRLKEMAKNRGFSQSAATLLAIAPASDLVFLRLENANETLVFRAGKMEMWPGLLGYSEAAVFSNGGNWLAVRTRGEDRPDMQRFGPMGPISPGPAEKGAVYLRSSSTGETKLSRFTHDGPVHAVAPDGSLLVVRAEKSDKHGNKVRLVHPQTGKPVKGGELTVAGLSQSACFSRDGRLLAIATEKETSLWDVGTMRVRWKLPGGAGALAFSPDGARLAGIDSVLRLWDVAAGKAIGPERGPLPTQLHSYYARAGRIVAQNMHTEQVQVWDWKVGRPLFTTSFYGAHYNGAASWLSGDGQRLMTCDQNKVRVFDIASGKVVREFKPMPPELTPDKWRIAGMPVPTPDAVGACFLFAEGNEDDPKSRAQFVHWDVTTGKLIESRDLKLPPFRRAGLTQDPWVVWIFDGNGGDDTRMIDVRTGRPRHHVSLTAEPGRRSYGPITSSRGGHVQVFQVYSMYGDENNPPETVLVEAASEKPLMRFPVTVTRIERDNSVRVSYDDWAKSVSPDGRWLAVARKTGIELWDLIEQKKIPFHAPHVVPEALSRNTNAIEDLSFLSSEHLIVQYADMSALIWEMPAAARTLPAVRIGPTTWDDLAAAEALPAQRAVWAVKVDPKAGYEMLRRVKRVDAADEKLITALYADLASNRFAVREAATRRLREFGRTAETFLAAAKPATAEQAWRARLLLDAARSPGTANAEERRAIRAVQAAELLGGDGCRALLADWAKGDSAAVLTREAKAALTRWVRP